LSQNGQRGSLWVYVSNTKRASLWQVASVTSFKKAISSVQEDSVQIPTQRSQILCFHPDDLVKRPVAHQLATSVRTTWQYCLDTHQCLEASNISSLHLSGRHGNMSGRYLEFKKISALQRIHPNEVVIPSRWQLELEENYVFLRRHRYGKTAATIWTT